MEEKETLEEILKALQRIEALLINKPKPHRLTICGHEYTEEETNKQIKEFFIKKENGEFEKWKVKKKTKN